MTETNNARSNKGAGRLHAARVALTAWGREVCYANDDQCAGRILEIKKGHGLSLANNEETVERIYLLSGFIWCHLNNLEFELIPGACLTIYSSDTHHLTAVEDSVVLNVSSSTSQV